jgi:hypothetical protein
MIVEKIGPHPDMPGIEREVVVEKVDRIDYVAAVASILIRVVHRTTEGEIHPYLGSFTAFMTSSNEKFVDAKGNVVEPDTEGAMGEFDWLYAAIDAGLPLHKLIRSMIQRNVARGNFDNGNFRD